MKAINSHYMHNIVRSAFGYQAYVSELRKGKGFFRMNLAYFFFSFLWFIHYKMYLTYIFSLSFTMWWTTFIFSKMAQDPFSAAKVFFMGYLTFHLFLTLVTYHLLYIKMDNAFYKANYDFEKCMKIAQPNKWWVSFLMFFALNIGFIATIGVFYWIVAILFY